MVFVGGVHGVGKTSLCRRLAAELGAEHVSASGLISDPKRVGRIIESVEDNQRLLVERFRAQQFVSPLVLFDGHFVLSTRGGRTERVPMWTFQEIGPSAIVLLTAPAITICRRLMARNPTIPASEEVDAFQAEEFAAATAVASTLQVPILPVLAIDDSQYSEVSSFIRRLGAVPTGRPST